MASTVANNPYDASPPAPRNTGIVANAMGAGPKPSQSADQSAGGMRTYQAETANLNRATDTTAGQLDSILANDSPLMQRARALAAQQMAQRGIVNSSMGVEAGVGAMLDRATPIAQTDAQLYANRGEFNLGSKNMASQFNAGEQNKMILQKQGQGFLSGQNALDRSLTSSENTLNRTLQTSLADKNIDAQKLLQKDQQTFSSGENALNRNLETNLTDKKIDAEKYLQKDQQTFNSGENALNRQASIDLQTAQNNFTALQNQLGRDFSQSMTLLQDKLNTSAMPKTFALNLMSTTTASINSVMADPNTSPDAKTSLIDNIINNANSTAQWGSTFSGTPLPSITVPGGTSSTLTPGGVAPVQSTPLSTYGNYVQKNPDLLADWKNNYPDMSQEAYGSMHYQKFGKNEGRAL